MKLTVQDSNVLKGIAILIMLWHHLFDSNHVQSMCRNLRVRIRIWTY